MSPRNESGEVIGAPSSPNRTKTSSSNIRQRMLHELLKDGIRHRANMAARECGLNDLLRSPDACHEHLCIKLIVVINTQNLSNEFHAVRLTSSR